MRRVIVLLLLGTLATLGLTACMSDDDESESAASAQARRSAALVSTGAESPGGYQLTIQPITKTDQAIVADSFGWGLKNNVSAALEVEAGAGKTEFQDFQITKSADAVSALLFQHAAQGTHFPQITITVSKGLVGAKPYMTYTLENAYISSYSVSGSNPNTPAEQVSFTFAKMTIQSSSTDEKTEKTLTGNTGSWDISALKQQ
jgi:type VI secretion system secreted protein Hcp